MCTGFTFVRFLLFNLLTSEKSVYSMEIFCSAPDSFNWYAGGRGVNWYAGARGGIRPISKKVLRRKVDINCSLLMEDQEN